MLIESQSKYRNHHAREMQSKEPPSCHSNAEKGNRNFCSKPKPNEKIERKNATDAEECAAPGRLEFAGHTLSHFRFDHRHARGIHNLG